MAKINKNKKAKVIGRVLSNKKIAADHYLMEIQEPFLASVSRPGQFVLVKAGERTTNPLLRAPLGIHSIGKSGISLLYKVIGLKTQMLKDRAPGTDIDLVGPLGNGFIFEQGRGASGEAFLIAGGHGVAPLYALAERLAGEEIKVKFFMGARGKEHILRARELRELGLELYIATDDGTMGYKGYVTECFRENFEARQAENKEPLLFACGPRPMLKALDQVIRGRAVNAQFSLDAYMACGIGACLGCALPTENGYKLVCKDGPVFSPEEIDWDRI